MPCYRVKMKGGGYAMICGKLGPHCRGGCGAPGDAFLCDWPVGPGKTCDAPLCADHAHEVAPEVHYCPGHFAEYEKFRAAGGVVQELANVVPFARPGRPAPATGPNHQPGFFDGPLGEPFGGPVREVKRPAPAPKKPEPPAQRGLFDDAPLDMNKLSRPALEAAMKGGTAAWGRMGSASTNVRYCEPKPRKPGGQSKCHCGCGGPKTHLGMANGVCLMSGCEMRVRRWVREGI